MLGRNPSDIFVVIGSAAAMYCIADQAKCNGSFSCLLLRVSLFKRQNADGVCQDILTAFVLFDAVIV